MIVEIPKQVKVDKNKFISSSNDYSTIKTTTSRYFDSELLRVLKEASKFFFKPLTRMNRLSIKYNPCKLYVKSTLKLSPLTLLTQFTSIYKTDMFRYKKRW